MQMHSKLPYINQAIMKRLTQILPIILAAVLQIMPLVRNLFINSATGNTIAFILRWGLGSTAAIGAYDACSGASGVPLTTTNHIYCTAGTYISNNITFTIGGGNNAVTGDYFLISTTTGTLLAGPLLDGQSTTNGCLPPGLVFKSHIPNGATTIYGVLYGTPSNTISTLTSNITVTPYDPGNAPYAYPTNIAITVLPAASGSAPIITNQPAGLTNNVSSNATFSVTAGPAPLNYQWYYNTNTALLNATNTSLTLTNIQLTNAGNYRVIITNSSGSTTSSFAALTVWQPPVITNQPAGFTNNVSSNATFAVTAGGVPGIAYQWFYNTNTALLNATNTSLTLTNIQFTNAGNYRVIITNSAGSVTSSFAQLTVWQPPNITSQPVGITSLAGSSPTFSVTAGGVPAVSYQWNLNTNTVLAGATGNSYGLANIRASQSGTCYSVVITNSAGSVTSSVAKLVVTNPLPSNLTFTAPVATGSAFQFSFTPVVGLTNTVLTNGLISAGTWNVFTNIPPPATATPITISNVNGTANLFFRIMILP